MQRFLAAAVALALLGAARADAAEISIACSALGKEHELCKEGIEAWAKGTGNTVRIVSTPNSATERLALYQQLLAAKAPDVDVFQIDVVWPGILADHFVDLGAVAQGRADQHFRAIIANNTVRGRLVAMPWGGDAGVLYYRRDLLDKYGGGVPQTWAELTETARVIQEGERRAGNAGFWGYVWQGRAYEGLTVNALEWVHSHGGGTIVDKAGEITINNQHTVKALEMAAAWIGTISPEGVLNYTEEEARGVFQGGNAAFMRNWPYAWGLAQGEDSPVRNRVGVARLPKGGPEGRHASGLGGQQLAVSRYSRHPELAADLVMYLTSPEEQKRRALEAAFNPTIPALFRDPDIAEKVPFIVELHDILVGAVARPSAVTGRDYNRVSATFFDAVHKVLSGRAKPDEAVAQLEQDLRRARRRGWSG